MYVVLVANCDPPTGTIVISGHSEWKNPYGKDVTDRKTHRQTDSERENPYG